LKWLLARHKYVCNGTNQVTHSRYLNIPPPL
jgi:hypothetical protein